MISYVGVVSSCVCMKEHIKSFPVVHPMSFLFVRINANKLRIDYISERALQVLCLEFVFAHCDFSSHAKQLHVRQCFEKNGFQSREKLCVVDTSLWRVIPSWLLAMRLQN